LKWMHETIIEVVVADNKEEYKKKKDKEGLS
jgi:hypothetical protein